MKSRVFGAATVLTAAVVITWFWYELLIYVGSWAILNVSYGYHLVLEHLAGVIFLLAVVFPYHRWIAPVGLGVIWRRTSVLPAVAVVAVYVAEFTYGKLTSQGAETWVVDLLRLPQWQLVSAFLTILVLAPVSEEIVFRGVLLNVFRTSRSWTLWVGAVIVALIFPILHRQYQNISTLVEIMAMSAIFSWARIRSGGLLLPVLLHALASVFGVFFTSMS